MFSVLFFKPLFVILNKLYQSDFIDTVSRFLSYQNKKKHSLENTKECFCFIVIMKQVLHLESNALQQGHNTIGR
jgi:hypothetical protein